MVSLPAIDPDACVHGRARAALCTACIETCPADALGLTADGIVLDSAACTGCAACVSACPEAAVTLPRPEPVRHGDSAIMVCARHPAAKRAPAPPCIRHAALRDLAALWSQGTRRIACATGDCATCPDRPADDSEAGLLADAVAALNALLAVRGLPGLTLEAATAAELRLWQRRAEHAPRPGRRALLMGLAPVHEDHGTALIALQSRPAAPDHSALFAHAPVIDALRCTGCDACIRLCPHDALILRKAQDGTACYDTDAGKCTGCGLCEDVCSDQAVTVAAMQPAPAPVTLRDGRCRACGTRFHMPAVQPDTGGLCRICRDSAHHKKLFQVLS